MDGELEPCGCSPKTDFGGVARLSGYIAEHGKELSPYILIDAGNFTGKDTPQGRLKAETMLKAFSAMKPVTKSICLKCHTKSNSPGFKYPAYLEKIKHN